MTTAAPTSAPRSGTGPAVAAILAISAGASLFLFWLVYVHPAAATSTQYAFLPALNAVFNGLAATALLIGYTFIRARKIRQHRASMITAFVFSTLFLVGYIAHHALHGDVRYLLHAAFRTFYLWLLASHIILAVVALPLVLVTFFFSLSGRIPQHRKVALDLPAMALRLHHRRDHLRHAPPRPGKLISLPASSTENIDVTPSEGRAATAVEGSAVSPASEKPQPRDQS